MSVVFGLHSCSQKETAKQDHWPLGVKYEIFVLSFSDSNGDGKGDLKGVTQKLDYLQDLGVNGIWLMPIMPSPSYHKYDVTDYKSIHPDYGTLDDFKNLVDEAHKRGIRVIIDMVLNHTSKEHPWFLSASADTTSDYRDYYVWGKMVTIRQEVSKKEITLDSDNITQWHAVNHDTTAEHYYGFFSSHMPDLNFDNENVRNEFVDIASFWLNECKVDGFRFDAARHIYPDDRAWANYEFWSWYKTELYKIKPDVYLVGEVFLHNPKEVSYYTKGLPSLFNFSMAKRIIDAINNGYDTGLMKDYYRMMDDYRSVNPAYVDAPILSNHDQNRIFSSLHNQEQKARLAASFLLTLPGAPFIYYGEELGMRGMKPDENIREPFLWGEPEITTSWMAPVHSRADSVESLSIQKNNQQSMYYHYKNLIDYRNSHPSLDHGQMKIISRLPNEVVGFITENDKEKRMILHNLSDREISLSIDGDLSVFTNIDLSTRQESALENTLLTMAGYSTVIMK